MATNALANDILAKIDEAIGTGVTSPYSDMGTARLNMSISATDIQTDAYLVKTEAETATTDAQQDYEALEAGLNQVIDNFTTVADSVNSAIKELDYRLADGIDATKLEPSLDVTVYIPTAEELDLDLLDIPAPDQRGIKDVSDVVQSKIDAVQKPSEFKTLEDYGLSDDIENQLSDPSILTNYINTLIAEITKVIGIAVAKPAYLSINNIETDDLSAYLPDFSDLKDSYKTVLAELNNVGVPPDIEQYKVENFEYAFTTLWDELGAVLSNNLKGSTGLDPVAEQALFDRHRQRIISSITDEVNRVTAAIAGRGYSMPPGKLATALRMTIDKFTNEDIDASSDIMGKQAELMQANMHHAIDASLRYEELNSNIMFKMKGFEIEYKKFMVSLAVDIYKLTLDQVKLKADILVSAGNLFDLEMKNLQAHVDMKRIYLEQEKMKVDMNQALVNQYRAEIEGTTAQIGYYKVMGEAIGLILNTDTIKAELFKTKLAAYSTYVTSVEADYRRYSEELKTTTIPAEIQKILGEAYRTEANSIDIRNTSEVKRVEAVLSKFRNIVEAAGQELKIGEFEINRYTRTQAAYSEEYKMLMAAELEKLKSAAMQLDAEMSGGQAKKEIIMGKIDVVKFKLDAYSKMLLEGGKAEVDSYAKEIDAIGKLLGSAYASINAIGIDVNKL